MTPAAALYHFFSTAVEGWEAYPETSVPSKAAGYDTDAAFPYMTYSIPTSAFNAGEVSASVNLWHRTRSESVMNDAADALYDAIGRGGVRISFDGGFVWLKRGSPFAQAIAETDPKIKRRYVNLTAEWMR